MKIITKNKKAFFEYEIIQKYEAGIVLQGSEVKAIRASRINLKDGFIKIIKSQMWLFNVHISHLDTTHSTYRPDETRERKLLMHKKQIDKLLGETTQKGYTLVPLMVYFNDKNRAKIQIALAKGKNIADKRETIKKRIANQEARRAMKNYHFIA
jgi:SsrA-binding protein